MTFNYILNTQHKREPGRIKKIHIFSDSQCAIGHLTLGWEDKNHKTTIHETKQDIQRIREAGIEFEISWTPGHANIRGNEEADRMAKEAAEEAKEKGARNYAV